MITPLEQAETYAKGNREIQDAWESGFVAGISHQIQKEVIKRMEEPDTRTAEEIKIHKAIEQKLKEKNK